MPNPIVPVILAGGQGTRLWPMSRAERPKQFLPLLGPASLYQETLQRVDDADRYLPPLVLTNSDYRFLVAEQAQEVGVFPAAILLEPVARNTAAAIAAAAVFAGQRFGDDVIMHILPSDHAVTPDPTYWAAIDAARDLAARGRLVTFGIQPHLPETGYGYIEGGGMDAAGGQAVARFVEKPDRQHAEAMLASGNYFWNSGMFALRADTFLAECRALAPLTFAAASEAVATATGDLDFTRLGSEAFSAAPDISVDYAIFERTRLASVLPVDFGWSDLGSWDAVWNASPRDAAGNAGSGSVTFSNSSGSLVFSERAHVAVEGITDLAVIASEDAIYIGKLSEAQKVGAMVRALRRDPRTQALTETHRTAHRPWGGYSSVLSGERFEVKRLFVKPGHRLSLQRHFHRSEHWIVVRGTAEVTLDGSVSLLSENESIYLPAGCTHRLANPGRILLELIEVQTGSYLSEDDIVRIEDDFGRD